MWSKDSMTEEHTGHIGYTSTFLTLRFWRVGIQFWRALHTKFFTFAGMAKDHNFFLEKRTFKLGGWSYDLQRSLYLLFTSYLPFSPWFHIQVYFPKFWVRGIARTLLASLSLKTSWTNSWSHCLLSLQMRLLTTVNNPFPI